ncbi:hypothetical protein ACFQPA_06545 [Halomarina halobia]|uniref:Uncharacterized protein n=1 Tax=Halomarina halobia TaxID=3033386 RepID=A0ABD6A6S5_9EURY|nr:hypothetical protein [Halomarina sp. PSR21]
MEDVTGGDRGQLIVVTGLTIALVLVVVVLLLNVEIYSSNLATRSVGVESQPVIEYQSTTVENVGELLDQVNAHEYTGWSAVRTDVRENVSTYNDLVRRQHLDRGHVADIDEPSLVVSDGYLIRQSNASRTFTSANTTTVNSSQGNWTVAWNVSGIRGHRLTVTESSLAQTNDPRAGFHVAVVENATNAQWHAYIYRNSTHVLLAVKNASETSPTAFPDCAVSGPTATIDVTAGTVNGTACPGLRWAAGVSGPYDVEYRNGEEARGTYELTVQRSDAMDTHRDTYLFDPTDGTSPYYSHAAYSLSLDLVYETAAVHYRAPVRIAPGEPA